MNGDKEGLTLGHSDHLTSSLLMQRTGLTEMAVSWQHRRPDWHPVEKPARWKWAEVTEAAASYKGLSQKGGCSGATKKGEKTSAEL